jgi:hypothetical protein
MKQKDKYTMRQSNQKQRDRGETECLGERKGKRKRERAIQKEGEREMERERGGEREAEEVRSR